MRRVFMKMMGAILALTVISSAAFPAAKDKKEEGEGIQVKLGKDIEREWKDVKADKYAYGPKQEYDQKTKVTHIYLPYGNNLKFYGELTGRFKDPEPGTVATFHSVDGGTNAVLTYKITFDKPISDFIFTSGRFEYGLVKDTCAGVEYSIDGNVWKNIKEVKGSGEQLEEGTLDSISSPKIDNLRTRTLYIRYYSRSLKSPKELWGPGRWIKVWIAGDPGWGDVATTFFKHHPQLWVTAAK